MKLEAHRMANMPISLIKGHPTLPPTVFGWCALAGLSALIPLGLQLNGWLAPLLILLGLTGVGTGLRGIRPPSWLRLILTIGASSAVLLSYEFEFGRDTGAGLLAAMLALKLLETNSLRDARALLSFSLFAIMAAFLQDEGPITLLLCLTSTTLIIAALARVSEIESGETVQTERPKERIKSAGILILTSLPLAAVAFLLFPRLSQPMWGLPDNSTARTGLSESMAPGDISELFFDDSPVLRATFSSRRPQRSELYWRGPVLSDFDGRTWRRMSWARPVAASAIESKAERLAYELVQEPTDRRWVLGLDVPHDPSERDSNDPLEVNRERSLFSRQALTDVRRYQLSSSPAGKFDIDLPRGLQRLLVSLPDGFNARTAELIEDWRALELNEEAIVREALNLFNREFTYSLTPPPLGRDSVDDFLFETREGYCEHFASAFTVMMRMAGIPARVVTGYHGGQYNPLGDYILVVQSDAHAWSEIWLQGRGWVRVDPTAAVAPERVRYDTGSEGRQRSRFEGLGILLDAADWLRHGWNSMVLGFNAARQRSLLLNLGIDMSDWREVGLALLAGFGLALALTLWLVLRGGARANDPLVAAWLQFCRRLGKRGVERAPHEPPLSFGRRAAEALPDQAGQLLELSQDYSAQRYALSADEAERARLIRALRGFRPHRPRRAAPPFAPPGVEP